MLYVVVVCFSTHVKGDFGCVLYVLRYYLSADFGRLWVVCCMCCWFFFQLMLGDFGLCVVCDAFLFFSCCWETFGCVMYVLLFYFSADVGRL